MLRRHSLCTSSAGRAGVHARSILRVLGMLVRSRGSQMRLYDFDELILCEDIWKQTIKQQVKLPGDMHCGSLCGYYMSQG